MKILTTAACLFLAGCATQGVIDTPEKQDCIDTFAKMQIAAKPLIRPSERFFIDGLHAHVGDIDSSTGEFLAVPKWTPGQMQGSQQHNSSESLDGNFNAATKVVQLACNEGNLVNHAIIAHELGHAVDFANGAQLLSEWQANVYGAQIMSQIDRQSAISYVKVIHSICINGNNYFCEREKAWKFGLFGQ